MAEWKVHFKTELATQFGTGNVAAAEDSKRHAHATIELICASRERLQLVFTKAAAVRNSAIEFGAESEMRSEVVLPGDSARVDLAAGCLYPFNAGAGVAGKQISEVGNETRFVREWFLRDAVERVVYKAGAQFLALVAGRRFDVQADGQGGNALGAFGFVEVPFQADIGISETIRAFRPRRAIDGEIRVVEVDFQVVGKTVVELEICCVLAEVGELGRLKAVVFVEELEVQGSPISDVGVIRVKGHLREHRPGSDDAYPQ